MVPNLNGATDLIITYNLRFLNRFSDSVGPRSAAHGPVPFCCPLLVLHRFEPEKVNLADGCNA